MKAMILAAGAGSRLSPLTDDVPKPLVHFQGEPLIEIIIKRLVYAGVNEIIINIHQFADQIEDYFNKRADTGTIIHLVKERELLDTGGGIKNAMHLLGNEPVLFHNVDILTEIDLKEFYQYHLAQGAEMTLAVKDRETTRSLLFTHEGLLGGWTYPDNHMTIITRHSRNGYAFTAFSGIYIINPAVLSTLPEDDVFSIMPWILEVSKSRKVVGFDQGKDRWFDLGRIQNFKKAEEKVILEENGAPRIKIKR